MYFRGFRILNAVIDQILVTAGKNIEEVILTGCSGNSHIHINIYTYIRTCIHATCISYNTGKSALPDIYA